jgi:DNA-binding transcriptional ArsR family regulator
MKEKQAQTTMAQQPEGTMRIPPIEIEMGLAYEFLKSLYVYDEQDKDEGKYAYELSKSWFEAIRLSCPPPMLEELKNLTLRYFSAHSELFLSSWLHFLGMVSDAPPPKDVSTFLSHLEMLDPLEIRLYWLGYYQRALRKVTPLDVVLQAAEGNREALEQLCKTALSEDPEVQEQVRRFMLADGIAMKERLLRFLRDWYERVFRPQEAQIRSILERDVEAKQHLQALVRPERLIELATNGLLYGPEAGIRRIILVPSFLGRPWNETLSHQDAKLFLYPVADEAVTPDHSVPPDQLVRLYQALADERRLRILKLLKSRSYSLQELSDEFGVSKTTMHHHLALLRTAGLVNMLSNEKQYSLRPETIENASRLLDSFLNNS